ncbi:NAD(P)/FAD-dependent oxidoreductase [Actinoallomurus iriomotensis]|uniref:Oxidoreductase n=1 Tax=Actinoallomurus iriomotensis TaxID=478107 RepID=A0A9W6W1E7_9ACTN|nr:NAD(P)/FAD-dependent oxidoreductase [Actinoallomurus iriomotensis]GLY86722.1 oxidoreductase [Actinoallomurus iriomotensis]
MTDTDVLIIGAGMAGLAAARRAQRDGVDFLLLEAGDRVGGRVATDETDGFLLDRGFQVVNTAYPRLAALVDLAALDLGCFRSGVLVRHGDRLERYAHPLRDPRGVPGMLESAVGGVGTVTDRVRLAAIIARYAALPPPRLLDEPETTTAQAMSGLSPAMLDGLVRPYLTGVFADPELATSSHVLAMIVRSFVHGRIGLPRTGVGAVPAALAAPLPTERIRLHTPVERLSGTTAHTPSGPVRARVVLVATDPVTAARLLPELPAPVMHALTTVYHAASEPPLEEATLVLDADGFARPGGPSIANTVVVSNAVPAYAPPGRHLIATTVAAPDADHAAVRAELARVYGTVTEEWEHLATVRIPHALPDASPPMDRLRRPVALGDGRYVAGDHRDSPSVQGALTSGWRAAAAITAPDRPGRQ